MFRKSLDRGFAIGAFLCLLFSALVNARPFLTQDQNPFSLIHGQPQPVAAQLPTSGSTQWSLTLDITNTLNSESTGNESLLIDYESYNLRYALLHGLNENWALRVDIPVIHFGGGFLDNTIDSWHEFFGLPQANRPHVADDQYLINYTRNGQTVIRFDTPHSDLGDIQLALGRNIAQKKDSALSLWFSIDLPTGDQSHLSGNDGSDYALWLAGDYRFHPEWHIDTNVGILWPSKSQLEALAVEDQVYFGYVGIEWQPHPVFDLRLQFNGHTRFHKDTQLKLLGTTHNLTFGGRLHVGECSDIDLAASEDIKVGATPDVSFLISWHSRIDCR